MLHIKNNKIVILYLLFIFAIFIVLLTVELPSLKNDSETNTEPKQNATKETFSTVNNYIINNATYTTNNTSTMTSETEYFDNDDLKFSDLDGIKFWFSSGAGAWSTSVTIHSDGTYSAYYHDSETAAGYLNPKSTTYECNFSGKFSSLKKTGPYQYSMKCESIEIQGGLGEVRFKDDIAYVTTDPYGFENADEFELYLPGKQISELPSDYLNWTNGYAQGEVLNCYGLYNVGGKEGFIVWPESSFKEQEIEEEISEPTSSLIVPYSSSEIAKMQKEYKDNDNFSFSDLVGIEFTSIREGYFGPNIMIQPDGTFNGTFNQIYSIDNDESLDSIAFECNYKGQFSSLTKTGPYEYTMKCNTVEINGTIGDETIVDGKKIITTVPYGFENADEFILYLPGKKVSELPEGLLKWNPDLIGLGVTSSYILYNVGGKNSFVIIPG